MPLLEKNVDRNREAFSGKIEAKELRWGVDEDLKCFETDPAVDIVLVSDCIYYEASIKPLVQTLAKICTSDTEGKDFYNPT